MLMWKRTAFASTRMSASKPALRNALFIARAKAAKRERDEWIFALGRVANGPVNAPVVIASFYAVLGLDEVSTSGELCELSKQGSVEGLRLLNNHSTAYG